MLMELINSIGTVGLPVVAAGVILYLFLRMSNRSEKRSDRLEALLLGERVEHQEPGALVVLQTTMNSGFDSIKKEQKEYQQRLDRIETKVDTLEKTLNSRPCVVSPHDECDILSPK